MFLPHKNTLVRQIQLVDAEFVEGQRHRVCGRRKFRNKTDDGNEYTTGFGEQSQLGSQIEEKLLGKVRGFDGRTVVVVTGTAT